MLIYNFTDFDHSQLGMGKIKFKDLKVSIGIYLAITVLSLSLITTPATYAQSVVATVAVNTHPQGVGVNIVTNKIYVANNGANNVSVINGATDTVVTTVPVGSGPFGVGVNTATNKIYVANRFSNTVSVINGATDTVIGSPIAVGAQPLWIGVNTATNKIYVINNGPDTVSVINGATDTVIGSPIAVGVNPDNVGVNSVTNKIYVSNDGANTVSVIFDSPINEHANILSEVQNIEEKLDDPNHPTSLVAQILAIVTSIQTAVGSMSTTLSSISTTLASIQTALTSVQADTAQILGMLQNPTSGLVEIKNEVSDIQSKVNDPTIGLQEIKTEVSNIEENMKIGATKSVSVPVSATSQAVVSFPNPFTPARDSNIKICVDASSIVPTGKEVSSVTFQYDVVGDGDFITHTTVQGGKLAAIVCDEVAAREFKVIIVNGLNLPQNVEVAVVWNTGKIIP